LLSFTCGNLSMCLWPHASASVCASVAVPWKKYETAYRMYMMTPALQRSTDFPYPFTHALSSSREQSPDEQRI
jgi:hypothetical protein